MGRKTGANKRAKKRADDAANELLQQSIEKHEAEQYESKEDHELFVLDTVPKEQGRKRKAEERETVMTKIKKQSEKNKISELDERRIRKIMNKHSTEKVLQLATANIERMQERKRTKRGTGLAKANFDLWDENRSNDRQAIVVAAASSSGPMAGIKPIQFKTVHKSSLRKDIQQPAVLSRDIIKDRDMLKMTARKTIKVEPAQPGQSYRPDEEQHQDVIGEALSIELRRKEAIDYKNAPVGGGKLSDETLAIMVGTSDEESSDDDEEEQNKMNLNKKPVKLKEKLTRAERNKQKRLRQEKLALEEKKRKKLLISSLSDAKKVAKEVRKEEAAKLARRQEILALKEEALAKPIGGNIIGKLAEFDPINAPSLPVALTDELKRGGLRTLKTKGSLVTDRIESLISRKMANRKATSVKNIVQGKRRKNAKGGVKDEFLLA